MSVTRINYFEAKQDSIHQLDEFMERVVAKVKTQPGCRSVRLLRSVENRAHLAVVEEWDSIEAHQKAATAIPPDELSKVRALIAKPPVGEYYQ